MNPTKTKYALERAKALYNTKAKVFGALKSDMSSEDKRKALLGGGFTVRGRVRNCGHYLEDYVEFPPDPAVEKAKKVREAAIKALDAKFQALKDELVLGDEAKALKLLREFEK